MIYEIQIKPRALKDCKKLPSKDVKQIFNKIEELQSGLTGQVKQLTNYTPEFRLRVGNYRVLFELKDNVITIYRIRHRRDAYK